jgi:hypothetical protein
MQPSMSVILTITAIWLTALCFLLSYNLLLGLIYLALSAVFIASIKPKELDSETVSSEEIEAEFENDGR